MEAAEPRFSLSDDMDCAGDIEDVGFPWRGEGVLFEGSSSLSSDEGGLLASRAINDI